MIGRRADGRGAGRRAAAAFAALVMLTITLSGTVRSPAEAAFVEYDGPSWMMPVAIVGDSLVWTTTPEIKAAVRADWWRDALFAYPGTDMTTHRQQIRDLVAQRPKAFVVALGGLDSLGLKDGRYDWNHVRAQIHGILDDITAGGVECVVWVGPNEDFDGGWLDYWATRINDEVKSELARRGIGVFGDWTTRSAGHPEYFLPDGSHFTAAGKAAFSSLIVNRLRDCTHNPTGSLDSVTAGIGSVTLSGWGFDIDTLASLQVHVYVDGQFKGSFPANTYRPDVAAVHPLMGDHRGFGVVVPVGGGPHVVCAFGINTGTYGYKNTVLGCRSVTVPADPFGSVDSASASGVGEITTSGWAIDPDTSAPIGVHVYVDGQFKVATTAGDPRADVGAAFPAFGGAHGYTVAVGGLERGPHEVCVFGIDAPGTPGTNALIGCRIAVVPFGVSPMGSFDSVVGAGSGAVRVRGWAIDPEVTSPIEVHVYVDWVFQGAFVADTSRADVGATFPGYGDDHGFDDVIDSLPPGTRDVCVFAINQPGTQGINPLLGCRTVAVP